MNIEFADYCIYIILSISLYVNVRLAFYISKQTKIYNDLYEMYKQAIDDNKGSKWLS